MEIINLVLSIVGVVIFSSSLIIILGLLIRGFYEAIRYRRLTFLLSISGMVLSLLTIVFLAEFLTPLALGGAALLSVLCMIGVIISE